MADHADHTITARDRTLAQLALAAGEAPASPCPDAGELARLVDGRPESIAYLESGPLQDELWNHLAHCPTCYEQWRIIAEVQLSAVKKTGRGKIISITGALLAAAASIMVFVALHDGPVPQVSMERVQVAELLDVPQEPAGVDGKPAPLVTADSAAAYEAQRFSERQKEQVQKRSQARPQAEQMLNGAPPLEQLFESNDVQDANLAADAVAGHDLEVQGGEVLLELNRVIPTLLQRLKQAETGAVLEVKTYKRDRGFSIEKRGDEQVFIREYGFQNQEMVVSMPKLKKTLKALVKTEFPRSNKVWLSSGLSTVRP